jgi:hypothetical protein
MPTLCLLVLHPRGVHRTWEFVSPGSSSSASDFQPAEFRWAITYLLSYAAGVASGRACIDRSVISWTFPK